VNTETAKAEITTFSQEMDPAIRMLKLASLVSMLFRDLGYKPIVVGGSAIEIYTEGEYASGDLDFAWKNKRPPLADIQKLMLELGAEGGPRSFEIGGMFIDLLGEVESIARTPFQTIAGPYGEVEVVQAEMLLAERILAAEGTVSRKAPSPNEEALKFAKILMMACVTENITIDWTEAVRVANDPEYKVGRRFMEIRNEIAIACATNKNQTQSRTPE
jgi:hypothetical protein